MTDQPSFDHPTPVPGEAEAREVTPERPVEHGAPALGEQLREARERAGLDLSDLAEVTHVRRIYLAALEEGRYADLPENVYARNFVRLYANAVGLAPEPLLERYARERQRVLGQSTLEQRLERDRDDARQVIAVPSGDGRAKRRTPAPAWLAGPLLPTLALVAVVVGLAVWGFNGLFANGAGRDATAGRDAAGATQNEAAAVTQPTDAIPAASDAAAAAAGGATTDAAAPTQVRVSIVTDPPGASISIDGFPVPGVTPLQDVPVTAREGRVVRAELDGFEPSEMRADLRQDADVTLALTPLTDAGPASPGVVGAEGSLTITVTDTAWLEVYRSTARNEGERLVYTTAQPGASYRFEPPVFVYTGNAAGVRLNLDGQDLGPMGSPGAVLGRAFPE